MMVVLICWLVYENNWNTFSLSAFGKARRRWRLWKHQVSDRSDAYSNAYAALSHI